MGSLQEILRGKLELFLQHALDHHRELGDHSEDPCHAEEAAEPEERGARSQSVQRRQLSPTESLPQSKPNCDPAFESLLALLLHFMTNALLQQVCRPPSRNESKSVD